MTAGLDPGAIRLRNVSRRFKVIHERNGTLKETLIRRRRARTTDLWALRDVSLDIAPGESVGLVGRNGSGKSTLLKMLAGIVPPHSGSIETGGSVASMLELGAGFHPDFTGRENVFMNGAIHGLSERTIRNRLDEIIAFSELEEFIDMPVRTYSSGMQMRLAFAVASHVNPDILLLDEVLAVGDEAFQRKCMGRIHAFRRGGGTLIFVSHDPNAVEQICDRAILIEAGEVVLDGPPPLVMEAYHRRLARETQPIRAQMGAAPLDSGNDDPEPISSLGGWGSGDLTISSVRLLGDDGETDRFVSGDGLRVEVMLVANSAALTPNVGVSIMTGDGTVVLGTNTRIAEFTMEEIVGSARLTFDIPRLPLQEGAFDVTVAATSADERTVYHWLDHAAAFSVFHRNPGIGIVAFEGTWTLTHDGTPAGQRVRT